MGASWGLFIKKKIHPKTHNLAKVKRGRQKGDGQNSVAFCRKLSCAPLCELSVERFSRLPATHALMLLTETPRGSSASCRVCHLSRPGRFVAHTPRELARLLGAACAKLDPTALSWRSVSRRKKGCLVGQGFVTCDE